MTASPITAAAMPSETLVSMANLAMDIRKVIDDALNSAIPEPCEVSDHATKAIIDLFAPILAEKERLEDELEGTDWHAVEAGRQRDVWKARALAAEAALAGERERWRDLVKELADELEVEIDSRYPPENRHYASIARKAYAAMGPVRQARAMLAEAAAIRAQGE